MAFGMTSRPRPVLIVDDDVETLAAERQLLAESGFRVVEAHDGAEALQVVQDDPPAVVVLDVQMPGMDGPSFARGLRIPLRRVAHARPTGPAEDARRTRRPRAHRDPAPGAAGGARTVRPSRARGRRARPSL